MKNFLRPEYSRMYEVMRVRLGKNQSKCIFIILIFHLIQSFLFSLTMSPLMVAGRRGLNFSVFALSSLSTVFVFFLAFQFLYGINSFFTKIILARKDVMGVLSSGFRDKTKRAHFLSAAFTLILIISALIASAVIFQNKEKIFSVLADYFIDEDTVADSVQLIKTAGLAVVFCAVFFTCGIFISVPFLFSWNIIFDDKKISAPGAMKKSFSLMIRNYFHFIGFVIYSCLKNAIFIAVCFGINMNLASGNSVFLNFLSMLLGFFAFIQEYTMIAKTYASIPIYYYSLLSVNGLVKNERKENENSSQ